jgi:hypothetical protein
VDSATGKLVEPVDVGLEICLCWCRVSYTVVAEGVGLRRAPGRRGAQVVALKSWMAVGGRSGRRGGR